MYSGQRYPGPQLTKASLITAIPYHHRQIICSQLDVFDKWKKFVGFIRGRDGSPRYSDLHILLFDREKEKRHGSPTDSVLSDWKTLRPTIGDFLEILKTVELMGTADYIHQTVLQLGPIKVPVQSNDPPGSSGNFPGNNPHSPPSIPYNKMKSFAPTPDQFLSQQTMPYEEHPPILDEETQQSIKVYVSSQPEPIPFYSYDEIDIFTEGFNSVHLNDGGRFLGKGGYGEVFLGIRKIADGVELLAIKRFNESSLEYLKQFKTELGVIFMNCQHPNLLSIKGICTEQYFCVAYEYMDSGTLEQKLKPEQDKDALTSEQRLNIAVDVAEGIRWLHQGGSNPIVHRDIKPANILLDSNLKAKVGDYGLMRVQTMKDNSHTNVTIDVHGSVYYMPPEANNGTVSPKWDVYSFGVVLLELLFAKGPAYVDAEGYSEKMIEYIFDGEFEEDPLSLVDPKCDWNPVIAREILDLVERCGQKWKKRPSISGGDSDILQTLFRIQEKAYRLSR